MSNEIKYTAIGEFARGHGWTHLVADGSCGRGRCILFGIIIRVSVAGAAVTVYDGQDASGRLVAVIEAAANLSWAVEFAGGLRIEDGIYVDLGTNVDDVLVVWDAADRSKEI